MARLLLIATLALGLLQAPSALAAPAAAPPNFAKNEQDCVAEAARTFGGGKTEREVAARLWTTLGDQSTSACRLARPQGVPTKALLDAVDKAVADRLRDYGCGANSKLAACEGLRAAASRTTAMRALLAGPTRVAISADQTGLLHYRNSLQWNREYLTFGTSAATGVSLLKLALKAGPARGTAMEAAVAPDTAFEDLTTKPAASPEPAPLDRDGAQRVCDDFCVESTGKVVALFALYITLDAADQPAVGETLDATAKQLQATREKWDAYHFGGGTQRIQLPWELVANGVIFNATRPRDADGPLPFPNPPDWALTLVHPSIGLALKDSKGADSNVVGVVEVLGFSKWSYGADNARQGEWGLSAIAAYQPRDNGDDWGYGVLARLPWRSLNVAWTRTDMKGRKDLDQFLLSIDISQFLGTTKEIGGLFKLEDPGK